MSCLVSPLTSKLIPQLFIEVPMATVSEQHIEVGKLHWFYRDAQPNNPGDRPLVLLLHGIPAQGYSWRNVLPALADQGIRAIAPDWLGFGFSDKPDKRDFAYTPDAFVTALGDFIQALELDQISLVVQGFLGSVGLQYALRHPGQVNRLAIFNAPLTPEAKLPWKMKQLGLPLIGDMLTQDPLLVDRTLEGGGGYRVEDADLDVYRRPFLQTSDTGRALLATVQNLKLPAAMAEIQQGFQSWEKPVLVGWGDRDPWLPMAIAETFAKSTPNCDLTILEEVGHYPQEDWHEKVNATLLTFLRQQVV
jgi:pimeloyl-ACP methyl ester carboxylesterase